MSHVSEFYGLVMLNNRSAVYVVDGNTEYHVTPTNCRVEVVAPDGWSYPLKGSWTAVDLVSFMKVYPLEDPDCSLLFTLSAGDESVTLEVTEYTVLLDEGEYNVYFS